MASKKTSDVKQSGPSVHRVVPKDVDLVAGKVTKDPHNGAVRQFWRILHRGVQVGKAVIVARAPEIHQHPDASITVELNSHSRGRGIGTIAFRRASELSGYSEVYGSVRKGNKASQVAMAHAGFTFLEEESGGELLLVWRRTVSEKSRQ
jgi:hypothetical protein